MGTYLPKPITDKVSEDSDLSVDNKSFNYGSSSMQGWRICQEDAHNTILDYDDQNCFFAVYDGHGGHEVATYTAEKLPKFIKSMDSYLKGDYESTLKEAFLKFDGTLVSPEVQLILKEIASLNDETGSDSGDEAEEVDHLYREANMPLDEVMEQYSKVKAQAGSNSKSDSNSSLKKIAESNNSNTDCAGGSGIVKQESSDSPSDETATNHNIEPCTNSLAVTSTNNSESVEKNDSDIKPTDNNNLVAELSNGELKNGDCATTELKSSDIKESFENTNGNSLTKGKGSGNSLIKGKSLSGNSSSKGKSSMKSGNDVESSTGDKRLIKRRKAAEKAEIIYKKIQNENLIDEEEEDDDDEEEEDFCDEIESEEDECEQAVNFWDDDDDEEDTSESEEEDDDQDETEDEKTFNEFSMNLTEEPGFDSGCTACVVLIHGTKMIVANIGDSRCVVCRDGEALDMSVDHKPEDQEETDRIVKAGGKITKDKRVNGGLNLSRSFGDHSYKQNVSLRAEEQMISALPDIRSLEITTEDSFMIVACDGIWNSMTSQEACDFVTSRLKPDTKLSSICEEMFDSCIAPNAFGDGTGCDNMTCVIVRLNNETKKGFTLKRDLEEDREESEDKRAKLEQ